MTNIRSQLDAALAEVTAAEDALATLLRDLRAGTRAQKVQVSDAVQDAFSRLRKARATLAAIREQIG